MKNATNIAKAIRSRRVERRLTQDQLALLSGVVVSLISRYENGHIAPSLATLDKIAKALRVPAGDLLKAG